MTPITKVITSMLIWGSVGIFVKQIGMPSGAVACARGFFGMLVLVLFMILTRQKLQKQQIKKNLALLLMSGAVMGANWILLFEAYNYTSVAVATVCYYMAPIFVMVASVFLFKEKLTLKRTLCIITALVGMVLVSGVINTGITGMRGIMLGLGAAVLYSSVVIMNKYISGVSAYEKTAVQLGTAAIAVLPYAIMGGGKIEFSVRGILFLAIVCILHTGIAYTLYFGAIDKLRAQTVAILSYIDPSSAVILSALVLKEKMSPLELIGAVLIICAALVSEINVGKPR